MAHEGKFRFMCHICGKGYNHKKLYEHHSNTHLGYKILKCGKCNKYATNYPQDLYYHIKICDAEPLIPCTKDGCEKKFTSMGYLHDHLKHTHK